MAEIVADRRKIVAAADSEAELSAQATAAEYLDVRLRLARLLLRIERSGTFHLSACSSVVQYAVRLGVPASEARMLVDLGRTLDADPAAALGSQPDPTGDESSEPIASVETLIRSGQLPVENAALVGRLLATPDAMRPGEDWLERAETLRTPELRRQIRQRLEEVAQGVGPLVSVTFDITERAREEFHRARVLVSREAAVHLTQGQAFTRIVRRYLDDHDERRRGAGPRQPGPTSVGERNVPASVRREILTRSGDRCEVPGCALDTFLQLAHIEPHADGGSREASNLLRLCHVHHTQFDADFLLFAGWDGERPVFRDARGVVLSGGATGVAPARERVDALVDAVVARRSHAAQVCERPPPKWPGA